MVRSALRLPPSARGGRQTHQFPPLCAEACPARQPIHSCASGTSLTSEITTRYNRWIAWGISRSHSGRNMAIRNRVNSVAWYLMQAQTPLNLTAMLTDWCAAARKFFEAPENVTKKFLTPTPQRSPD